MITATVRRLFLDHPASVNESYLQHLLFAGRMGVTLLGAGLAAIGHGLFPRLFQRTASTTIRSLAATLEHRFPG